MLDHAQVPACAARPARQQRHPHEDESQPRRLGKIGTEPADGQVLKGLVGAGVAGGGEQHVVVRADDARQPAFDIGAPAEGHLPVGVGHVRVARARFGRDVCLNGDVERSAHACDEGLDVVVGTALAHFIGIADRTGEDAELALEVVARGQLLGKRAGK